MMVDIGEVATFPSAEADREQAIKVLEEAAEAFAAWQQFDAKGRAMYRQPFLHKLFNELADLIMASSNMLRGLDRDPATTCECEPMVLEKVGLLLLLVDSARVYGAVEELESAHILEYGEKASETRLVQGLRELQEDVCMVIASLGVDDFTPYMQACERRNRWRGRYER